MENNVEKCDYCFPEYDLPMNQDGILIFPLNCPKCMKN